MSVYYKVLVNGHSVHGGSLAWSLPTQQADGSWTPGDWHEVTGPIAVSAPGLHLTREPARWWVEGSTAYAVEYERDAEAADDEDGDQLAVRRCRLLHPVPWEELQVWHEGAHTVRAGTARASGSARVWAHDSARVRASDSARVRAYDSAIVWAYDSASVWAYDSARVWASGSASVRAHDSASVVAYDSAIVEASDSACVRASDSAIVIRTTYHDGEPPALSGDAACIDRSDGAVRCYTAAAQATQTASAREGR